MQKLYKYSYEYLLSILPNCINEEDLKKYFEGDNKDFKTLLDVYDQFLLSAQNANRMPNVIKYEIRRNVIKEVLFNFNFCKILDAGVNEIYYKFRETFNVTSKDTQRNLWYKFSKSAIDSAKFLKNFKDVNNFKEFIEHFSYTPQTRLALPLLISAKVSGFGFALACDCLKELGYLNYSKPDTHLTDIFFSLGLSDTQEISVFETVVEMAEACREIDPQVTPYKIDKIMWLICSGHFYLDNVTIGSNKANFINSAKMLFKNE